MSEISFENEFWKEITLEEANTLSRVIKVFSEKGIPRIKEYYFEGKLERTHYNLTDNENVGDVIKKFPLGKISISENKTIDNYIIKETFSYTNLIADELKHITIFNKEDQIIASQTIDFITDIPDLQSTVKFYYDADGEDRFTFEYDSSGECFIVNDDQEYGNISGCNFSWTGFEYFKTALPLIPDSPLETKN